MKKYITVILTVIVLPFLNGCNDYLDVKPESSITSGSFWNSSDDCEAYLVGIYNRLRNTNILNTTLYSEDRGDSFQQGEIGPVTEAWAQSLDASTAPSWSGFYNLIYHINRLLTEVENISFSDQDEENQLKAETYALRALAYFQMAKVWGDVPIVLTPTDDANVELSARADVNDVFTQINSDITTALSLFPDDGYDDKNHISKPATYALLADVKMWTGKVLGGGDTDFETALDAIDKVENSGVSLLDDYASIFSSTNKKNDEIIFSLYFDYAERYDMYAKTLCSWNINVTGAINYDDLPVGGTIGGTPRHVYAPSEELKAAYAEYPEDVRTDVAMIDALIVTEGDTTVLLTSENKFRGTVYTDDRYYDDDIIVYRLADIILLKAEALAALNRTSEAVSELNRIKERAGIPDYSGSTEKVAVEKEILNERWKELFLELKRYPDLVRFHYGGTINIYDQVPNLNGKDGYPLYFPVEQSVMDNNDLIEQTEGY